MLEVSRSGDWQGRGASHRTQQNQALRRRLVELHEKYPALGLDSLYRLLKPEFGCSRKRVHRQMWLAGISSVRQRAYKRTTNSNHSHPIAPNLLQRKFTFDRPDQAWVGDITYIPTDEGWLYLAIVKDLCTRKIVGYAFSDRIDTQLTLAALCAGHGLPSPQATHGPDLPQRLRRPVRRQGLPGPPGCLWHPPEHVTSGRPLRQRCCRKFLQLPQM